MVYTNTKVTCDNMPSAKKLNSNLHFPVRFILCRIIIYRIHEQLVIIYLVICNTLSVYTGIHTLL